MPQISFNSPFLPPSQLLDCHMLNPSQFEDQLTQIQNLFKLDIPSKWTLCLHLLSQSLEHCTVACCCEDRRVRNVCYTVRPQSSQQTCCILWKMLDSHVKFLLYWICQKITFLFTYRELTKWNYFRSSFFWPRKCSHQEKKRENYIKNVKICLMFTC